MIRGIPSSDEFLFYPVLFPILVLWVLSILRRWSLNPTAVTSASEQSRKAAVTWLEHALVPALTSDGWAMRWCCSALLLQLSAGNWRLRTAWGEVCCGKLQRLMNSKVLKEMNTLWEINTLKMIIMSFMAFQMPIVTACFFFCTYMYLSFNQNFRLEPTH